MLGQAAAINAHLYGVFSSSEIVLSGQPELEAKLALPELRRLL